MKTVLVQIKDEDFDAMHEDLMRGRRGSLVSVQSIVGAPSVTDAHPNDLEAGSTTRALVRVSADTAEAIHKHFRRRRSADPIQVTVFDGVGVWRESPPVDTGVSDTGAVAELIERMVDMVCPDWRLGGEDEFGAECTDPTTGVTLEWNIKVSRARV